MDNNFNIGYRLFELRTGLKMSQEQLALRADITPTYLRQIEHNSKRPTVYVIEKICCALNISLEDFFNSNAITYEYDSLTNQILIQLQACSTNEKEFILSICKQLKLLRNESDVYRKEK